MKVSLARTFILVAGMCPLLGFGMLAGMTASRPALAATACSTVALSAFNVRDVTIASTTEIAAPPNARAYCRVIGGVRTDGEGAGVNHVRFQINLPAAWNGKFLHLGGGGLDGDVVLRDGLPQQIAKGYATLSTNAGHCASSGSFAFTAPGLPNWPGLIDYFYRSHHQAGIAAKNLVRAFYNAPRIARSYFMGCSGGGRQGLMAASRYPDDYDGIVSGAPWMDPMGTELWSVKNVRALLAAHVPASVIPKIDAAIMDQCDAADGTRDGLIQNPARCAFDPQTLVPSVLTEAQSEAIKAILAPVKDSEGNLIYPGASVTDLFTPYGPTRMPPLENPTPAPNPMDAQPWGLPLTFGGRTPLNWYLANHMINYLGLYQPGNNLNTDAFENKGVIPVATRKKLYANLKLGLADDPAKVAPYLGKDRKLILFHGYSDIVISPYRTVLFYESLAGLVGGYEVLQKSARLFMVPNMGHCINGGGPDVFGNTADPGGYPIDPQHDVLSALEDWVENGRAPSSIIATRFADDTSMAASVDRTMPLCPFPTEARYSGSGDIRSAANWSCEPNTRLLETGVNGRQAAVYGPSNQPSLGPR